MTDPIPSADFTDEVQQILKSPAAPDAFIANLRGQIQTRAEQMSPPIPVARPVWLRPAWMASMALLLVLFISTLVIGPQKVWAAFRGLFGYIPGIGVVQDVNTLRLLAEPVSLERDGVTVTIENAATDPDRTVLIYKVDGLSVIAANSAGEAAATGGVASLVLPDGTVFSSGIGGGNGWATGYRLRLTFEAIPAEFDHATLFIHRLQFMPEGAAPQDWQVDFQLVPAPADLKVMPVYEIPDPTPGSTPTFIPLPADTSSTQTLASLGITLALEQVIETETGYQFQGTIHWDESNGVVYVFASPYDTRLTSGEMEIPIEPVEYDAAVDPSSSNTATWAVVTNTKSFPGPVTITIPTLEVTRQVDVPFTVDLGEDPMMGQVWDTNIQLEVDGSSINLTAMQMQEGAAGTGELFLYFIAEPRIHGLSFFDPENYMEGFGGGGGGGSLGQGNPDYPDPSATFMSSFGYGKIPSGVRQLTITHVSTSLPVTEPFTWQPPAGAVTDTPFEIPAAALLTASAWQKLKDQPASSLPDGLGGTILLENAASGQPMPALLVSGLDGSRATQVDYGAWSTLSPDGRYVVYVRSSGPGLYLADLTTGTTVLIPNTEPGDYNPVWAPDSQSILFFRGGSEYDFYRIHPDGSDESLAIHTARLSSLGSWEPDGRHILLQSLTEDGIVVQEFNLNTGAVTDLFNTGLKKPVANPLISPDGEWIVYRGMEFGSSDYSLILVRRDGSQKRILADASLAVLPGGWSNNGEWLLASTHVYENGLVKDTPILIRPDTSEVLVLSNLTGQVKGWAQ